MKRNLIMGFLLLASITSFAQAPANSNTQSKKWKARLRVIDVIPPSSSYTLSGSDVAVSSSIVPELDFTYYFSKNLAAELILGTTHHTVKLGAAKTELGKVWLLPPTLNLQYHFPVGGVEPYIGAGINYTIFYGAKDEAVKLAYKNSVGFSTQLGADFNLNGGWFINVDIKKLFLKTDVTVNGDGANKLKGVKLDPWVLGVGIGVKL